MASHALVAALLFSSVLGQNIFGYNSSAVADFEFLGLMGCDITFIQCLLSHNTGAGGFCLPLIHRKRHG